MANRIPRFESHIRPMIRRVDRQNMLFAFDLWRYEDITEPENLRKIKERVNRPTVEPVHGEMPPGGHGGPWPLEWIDLFNRWVAEGCPRLEQVSSGVTYSIRDVTSDVSTLVAEGENPDLGYAIWLEPEFDAESHVRFTLYREPPAEIPPFGSTHFSVQIDFAHEGATAVFVNGAEVPRTPIPPTPFATTPRKEVERSSSST